VEVLCDGEVRDVVAGTIDADRYAQALRRGGPSPAPRGKRIAAVEAGTGKLLWAKADADTADLLPTTLCARVGRAFSHGPRERICLNARTGKGVWKAPAPFAPTAWARPPPTLVACDGVVLSADGSPGKPKASARPARTAWTVSSQPKRGTGALGGGQ